MKFGYIGLNKVVFDQSASQCRCPDCSCRGRSVEPVCFDCRHGHHEVVRLPHWAVDIPKEIR